MMILPVVGLSSPPIRLSNVVLPEPDGPHQCQEIALLYVQVQLFENRHYHLSAGVLLFNIFYFNQVSQISSSLR